MGNISSSLKCYSSTEEQEHKDFNMIEVQPETYKIHQTKENNTCTIYHVYQQDKYDLLNHSMKLRHPRLL